MSSSKPRHNAKKDLDAAVDESLDEAKEVTHDFIEYVKAYARENPGTAALWCLGIGFVLGWKMKPW